MSRAIARQFRFYHYGSEENSPQGGAVTYNKLVNGELFGLSNEQPAFQIGIQALPGTKFYLNNSRNLNNGIIIGSTGIYELNTENININITNLQFDGNSIQRINDNENACLIVDIIYIASDSN